MARAVRPGGGHRHGERKRDLHIVMIDATRLEMLEGRKRRGADHDGGERGVAPGNPPGQRGDGAYGGEQPDKRPSGAHERLGEVGCCKGPESEKEAGKPSVDRARPMGVVAGRRVEANFVQVEPAAAGEEFAHVDQPHGVVAVEQAVTHLGPPLGKQKAPGCRPGHEEQDRESEPPRDAAMCADQIGSRPAMPRELLTLH
jgi:hypothetical protein